MNTDFLIYEDGTHFITCLNLGSHIKICQDINGTLDQTNEIYNVPTSSPHLRPASREEMANLDWD